MNTKFEELQTNYKDSKAQLKELTQIRAEQIERIGSLDKRYTRAKKVAAHLEKQMKETRPNGKIDYLMVGNAEPSVQLLASLMAKDTKSSNILGALPENIVMHPQLTRRATMIASQKSNRQIV